MARSAAVTREAHPAPRRYDVHRPLLALALFGIPSLWGLRLVVNYAVTSHFCYPGEFPRPSLGGGFGWVWWLSLGLDLMTLLAAAAGAAVSYRHWRSTADEAAARGDLIEIGEGRTRFLSLWGLLISALFIAAVAFDLVSLWIVPICG